MKKIGENLVINTILLSVTAIIMRIIQIVYKVYISNEVGIEGMGLYKLIGTVSMVAITFATSGISSAVTNLVSEEVSKRNYTNVKQIIRKACTISATLGLIAAIVLFSFSDEIALYFFDDSRVMLAIRITAISIPFISLSSCVKGYFFAVRDVFTPITSQFTEKFIQISVVITLLTFAMSKGVEYGLAVLALGSVISEVFSFIYIAVVYKLEKKENKNFSIVSKASDGIVKRMFKIALPVAGNSYTMSIFKSVEMTLIPICLIEFGMSKTEAISMIGGVMGMVFPIVSFPSALLMSVGRIIIPEITRAVAVNNRERINSLISRSIGFTSVIGIISAFIFYNFHNQLGIAIYNRNDIGEIFKMVSFVIPFMYVDMIMGGILNGLNQQLKTLEYQILESILRLLCIYILLPIKGVEGLIITMFISSSFSLTLSTYRIIKVTNIKIDYLNWLMKPVFFAELSLVLGKIIWNTVIRESVNLGINLTIVILSVLIFYFTLVKLFKCIKLKD